MNIPDLEISDKLRDSLASVTGQQLKSYLLKSLDKYYYRFSSRLSACKNEFNEGAVHDLRVSIRKMDEVLKLSFKLFPSSYIIVVREKLKEIFDMLGALRDAQVMILSLQKMRIDYPEMNDFYKETLKSEVKQIKQIENLFHDIPKSYLVNEMFFIKLDLKHKLSPLDFSGHVLYHGLKKSYLKCYDYLQNVDADNLRSIHKVRISFKKFRYLFDLLRPFTPLQKNDLAYLQTYQDFIGSVQDMAVMLDNFNSFLNAKTELEKEALTPSKNLLEQRLRTNVELFLKNAKDLSYFDYFGVSDDLAQASSVSSPMNLIEGASGKN